MILKRTESRKLSSHGVRDLLTHPARRKTGSRNMLAFFGFAEAAPIAFWFVEPATFSGDRRDQTTTRNHHISSIPRGYVTRMDQRSPLTTVSPIAKFHDLTGGPS